MGGWVDGWVGGLVVCGWMDIDIDIYQFAFFLLLLPILFFAIVFPVHDLFRTASHLAHAGISAQSTMTFEQFLALRWFIQTFSSMHEFLLCVLSL